MNHEKMFLVTTNDRKLVSKAFLFSGLTDADLSSPEKGGFAAAVFASRTEVLFVRRPVDSGQRLDVLLDEQLRTHRVLGIYEGSGGRPFTARRALPLRYKGWVFGLVGDAPPEEQPTGSEREATFLAQNGASESAVHRLMARVMYRVQRATSGVTDPEPRVLVQALREAVDLPGFDHYTIALTSEQSGVLISLGRNVYYRTVVPRAHTPLLEDEDVAAIAHLRALVVVDGVELPRGSEWHSLEPGSALVIGEAPPARVL